MSREDKQGELKPCPFCGSAPRFLEFTPGIYPKAVICDTCNFRFDGINCVESWNTRSASSSCAPSDGIAAVLESIQEAHHAARKVIEDGFDVSGQTILDALTACESFVIRAPLSASAEPVMWSLRWPGEKANAMTTFSSKDRAEAYAAGCANQPVEVVPLYEAPLSSTAARITDHEIMELACELDLNAAHPVGGLHINNAVAAIREWLDRVAPRSATEAHKESC